MEEGRGVYRVLVGRPEGKRPRGRRGHRWDDNIKMGLREMGFDGANWIQLARDRVQWRACVNTVMNLRIP
jgi:transposase